MDSNDGSRPDPALAEQEPAPDLADWWVWGVRKVAGVMAELLLAFRWLFVLFVGLKLVTWVQTNDPGEVYQAGAGTAGFVAAWALAILLGRFAWSRESPQPERWRTRR